jgi:hypothetical protein
MRFIRLADEALRQQRGEQPSDLKDRRDLRGIEGPTS